MSKFVDTETDNMVIVGHKINRSVFVEATQWNDSTGNTYFSAYIFVDGKWIATLPFQYGYGDHYKSVALDVLQELLYIPDHYNQMWVAASEMGFDFYSTARWVNKKEMIK